MSHRNIEASVGTCGCCGMDDQPLSKRGTCVDEFACMRAWVAVRYKLAVRYRQHCETVPRG